MPCMHDKVYRMYRIILSGHFSGRVTSQGAGVQSLYSASQRVEVVAYPGMQLTGWCVWCVYYSSDMCVVMVCDIHLDRCWMYMTLN